MNIFGRTIGIRRSLTGLVVVLLVAAGLVLLHSGGSGDRTLTATFPRTTSLYAGAKVKVLGVAVGKVDSIKVKGTAVQVTMSYSSDVKLPDDVQALIVPPSIVGDRFIQLSPAYEDGAVLPDHARLGLDRTGVPVELDETYAALDKFAKGLGPNGANKDGALSRLVTATAANLSGHGEAFNETIRQLTGAISTLAGSSGDINDTVTSLSKLTGTLKGKDAELRALVTNLARVGAELNGQRTDISTSVVELKEALALVDAFVKDNRSAITTSVNGVKDVSAVLSRRTQQLEQLVDLAPVGLTSLANIYVPTNWDPAKPWLSTIAGRTGSANLRGALTDDLDTQLGFTLGAVCAALPPAQRAQIAAFCSTLNSVGNNLGALLSQAIESGGVSRTAGATSLINLMGGAG
ncbi:MCE family protein [Nocardioides marmorisolisilvae]|uniref:MCE family protein n=1 Tax=Nocardioides marmorisolisilvae TaxID=1542737 RepID=UPI00161EF331|nr:MCE family protein [Nocardioides marmorisolisilvae]